MANPGLTHRSVLLTGRARSVGHGREVASWFSRARSGESLRVACLPADFQVFILGGGRLECTSYVVVPGPIPFPCHVTPGT
jgi:hypothetical protein